MMLANTTKLALVLALFAPSAAAQKTTRVSLSSNGVEGNRASSMPEISANGRYVAFGSWAINLVAGDTNRREDVFVRDRQTSTTTRVSLSSSGVQGNSDSRKPSISASGRFVTFSSYSNNLVVSDTNRTEDVFVHDRRTATTTRVSLSTSGVQADTECRFPSISADGRFVAFQGYATNLVNADLNGAPDIFVHDRQSKTTTRVSVSSAGLEGNGGSFGPSLSADGRFIAFFCGSTNLVVGDTNGKSDVFVHDRQTKMTRRVSISSSGTQGNDHSFGVRISGDGRYLAFESWASNLVPGDTNGAWDIFVHELQTGTTTRVSVSSTGLQSNGPSGYYPAVPGISADGRFVAFTSFASNLAPGDTNGTWDTFVHDRQTMVTTRVSLGSNGSQGNHQSQAPSISASGRFVVFPSLASNLVPGDTNGVMDVLVRDRCPVTPAPGTSRLIGVSCKHSRYAVSAFGPRVLNAVPYVGDQFVLAATTLPPATTTYGALGLLGLRELSTPLDLSVTGLFLPRCFLHVDFLIQLPLVRDRTNTSTSNWSFLIPCDPNLVGLRFYAQVAILDSANSHSWMLTNAYEGKIGAR